MGTEREKRPQQGSATEMGRRLRDLIRRRRGSADDLHLHDLICYSELYVRYQEMPARAGNWHKVRGRKCAVEDLFV